MTVVFFRFLRRFMKCFLFSCMNFYRRVFVRYEVTFGFSRGFLKVDGMVLELELVFCVGGC